MRRKVLTLKSKLEGPHEMRARTAGVDEQIKRLMKQGYEFKHGIIYVIMREEDWKP